jgi:hypothetical protein
MNSHRDQPLQRARSSVDLASYTERAAAAEASRAAAGSALQQEKDHTKLNQIIQVRRNQRWRIVDSIWKADGRIVELPHKGCISSVFSASELAASVQQRWRLEAEQMGESVFHFHVEAELRVIARRARTRDETKGHGGNAIVLDDFAVALHQVVPI